jgi:hypothetical protein
MAEHGFVISAQIKGLALLPLNLLPQSIVSHAADKISAQLR